MIEESTYLNKCLAR